MCCISLKFYLLVHYSYSILAPSKASKIWAEEDMEFHTTSKSSANWGQGAGFYGNKGQNSNLVHYANSDSD